MNQSEGTKMFLPDRNALGILANALGLSSAVEIGTHQGVFADGFLKTFNGTLACVDPWIDDSPPPHATFLPCFVPNTPSRQFDEELARFVLGWKYGPRVTFHKMTSLQFAEQLEPDAADFVYIDGLHTLSAVKADILAFWPKLKSGGILAGHDYVFGDPATTGDRTLFNVAIAVNWFAAEAGLDLHVTGEDSLPSWYLRKP